MVTLAEGNVLMYYQNETTTNKQTQRKQKLRDNSGCYFENGRNKKTIRNPGMGKLDHTGEK